MLNFTSNLDETISSATNVDTSNAKAKITNTNAYSELTTDNNVALKQAIKKTD